MMNTLLGATPGGMDEAAEPKASLTLEGNQLGLLGITNPQLGQCIEICAEICIEAITGYKDEKGVPHPRITFTVESVELDEPTETEAEKADPFAQIKSMYPAM